MIPFTSDTRILQNPDLISTDMDGDTVMMGIERGAYYGVTGVGSRARELLAQPTSIDLMIPIICSEFVVDYATCRADLQKFVGDLLHNGLISLA